MQNCIFCHQPFRTNQELEQLPIGRRIAFDPARGRLWCICEECQSWTLLPFERRWEALEELERLTRARAKLLKQGENIALLKLGSLQLVRIGRANLREEAWWRYGDELTRRRDNARKVVNRGKWIDAGIMLAVTGIPIWAFSNAQEWIDKARYQSFGEFAWRGTSRCDRCDTVIPTLAFRDRELLQIVADDRMALCLPCPNRCGVRGGSLIQGPEAARALRRVLAYHNFAGAPEDVVTRATALVQDPADFTKLAGRLLQPQRLLGELDATSALTLEIALNDQQERAWLELELAELDRRWKEEEIIAAIADGELTRLPRC